VAPLSSVVDPVIDRRRFLALSTIVGASVLTLACETASDTSSLAQPDLLVALGPDAVRGLGRRYRASVPGESDAPQLTEAIQESRPWTARIGLRHPAIDDQVRDDFDAGRTVIVDGWLLSRTEARQCALYSTLQR
jgi:hypothetical protein